MVNEGEILFVQRTQTDENRRKTHLHKNICFKIIFRMKQKICYIQVGNNYHLNFYK